MLLDELAGLLQDMGDYNEALRIREHEGLLVFEPLGDIREILICRW